MTLIVHIPLGKRKRRKLTPIQRELQSDWNELLVKWRGKLMSKPTYELYRGFTYDDRGNHAIPSLGNGMGNAPLKEVPIYTGNQMIGIAQMAKSNAIPVFSQEEIVDVARMRR